MRCAPARACADFDAQWDGQFHQRLCRAGHNGFDNLAGCGDIAFGQFEDKFIMDLQQHPAIGQPRVRQSRFHPRHRSESTRLLPRPMPRPKYPQPLVHLGCR